jgi:hypothetical protein
LGGRRHAEVRIAGTVRDLDARWVADVALAAALGLAAVVDSQKKYAVARVR